MAYLSRLSLTNFRNFVELELDLPLGVSVFAGDNAQGKTSLLEAAYLLAIARSFRAENERELINFQAEPRKVSQCRESPSVPLYERGRVDSALCKVGWRISDCSQRDEQ